ncbi:MAG: PEP-CTERM sorting domain-containing protein [Candidatus Korobacteraceae bacterium]|jgi:hypothetical protein
MKLIKIVATLLFVLSLGSGMLFADIITNGNFSSGSSGTAGWTLTPAAQGSDFSVVYGGFLGSNLAVFGGRVVGDYDTLSQTLNTQAGYKYTVTFYLENGYGPAAADFIVSWDGTTKLNIPGTKSFDFTEYQFTVNGVGNDTLSFAGYQLPSFYYLADVSVSSDGPVAATHGSVAATPEPGSMILFGSGLLGLLGAVRRKFGMSA